MRRSVYNYNRYGDNLAQKNRRRFFIKLYLAVACAVLTTGAVIYGFFYSGWLEITSVSMNELNSVDRNQILSVIDSGIQDTSKSILGLKYKNNIYLFNPEPIRERILAQFPIIKSFEIVKEYPHTLKIDAAERSPIGTWCFGDDCSYFDEDGILWGKAMKSSGSLLLSVEDGRVFTEHQDRIDTELFKSLREAITGLADLKITIGRITIRPDSINDFYVYTSSGYYLMFNGESDIDKQLRVLKIFLDEKGPDFKAEYIDLRIEGRVYYK